MEVRFVYSYINLLLLEVDRGIKEKRIEFDTLEYFIEGTGFELNASFVSFLKHKNVYCLVAVAAVCTLILIGTEV